MYISVQMDEGGLGVSQWLVTITTHTHTAHTRAHDCSKAAGDAFGWMTWQMCKHAMPPSHPTQPAASLCRLRVSAQRIAHLRPSASKETHACCIALLVLPLARTFLLPPAACKLRFCLSLGRPSDPRSRKALVSNLSCLHIRFASSNTAPPCSGHPTSPLTLSKACTMLPLTPILQRGGAAATHTGNTISSISLSQTRCLPSTAGLKWSSQVRASCLTVQLLKLRSPPSLPPLQLTAHCPC